jgi:hypothetical protein
MLCSPVLGLTDPNGSSKTSVLKTLLDDNQTARLLCAVVRAAVAKWIFIETSISQTVDKIPAPDVGAVNQYSASPFKTGISQ